MTHHTQDHDSVADALEAAGGSDPSSMLTRVKREAEGTPASPAPSDYLVAVAASKGAVAIEIDSDTDHDVIVRGGKHTPDNRGLQATATPVDDPDGVVTVPSAAVTAWIRKYGCTPVLYDDVTDTFPDLVAADGGGGGC